MTHPPLILASQSPRRRRLLTEAGYTFTIIAPPESAEDGQRPGESPEDMVMRLARQKAAQVAADIRRGIIIGCDTVVVRGREILGKPRDEPDARRMLRRLAGHQSHVLGGLCLWEAGGARHEVRLARTTLAVAPLTDQETNNYLASGRWRGKAGGFGYQDGHHWLHILSGSQSNVVGLPLALLARMLDDFPHPE
uniref:dTTP/UTP pyrophosphatase n=1 Tax=Candidatus Kentrum sp. DK TaxID=2126562 RepID=A0A450SKD9_9GAMM|nr:MAG: septum formation protein [Candidatus Kentron sp. DK]